MIESRKENWNRFTDGWEPAVKHQRASIRTSQLWKPIANANQDWNFKFFYTKIVETWEIATNHRAYRFRRARWYIICMVSGPGSSINSKIYRISRPFVIVSLYLQTDAILGRQIWTEQTSIYQHWFAKQNQHFTFFPILTQMFSFLTKRLLNWLN